MRGPGRSVKRHPYDVEGVAAQVTLLLRSTWLVGARGEVDGSAEGWDDSGHEGSDDGDEVHGVGWLGLFEKCEVLFVGCLSNALYVVVVREEAFD